MLKGSYKYVVDFVFVLSKTVNALSLFGKSESSATQEYDPLAP